MSNNEVETMYKTEVIKYVMGINKRSKLMEALINKNEQEGWSFVNAIRSSWFGIILTFKHQSINRTVKDAKFDSEFFNAKINHVVKNLKN